MGALLLVVFPFLGQGAPKSPNQKRAPEIHWASEVEIHPDTEESLETAADLLGMGSLSIAKILKFKEGEFANVASFFFFGGGSY